jgi:hypothetical protein
MIGDMRIEFSVENPSRLALTFRTRKKIIDGAHTAKIIEECQKNGSIPDEQFVEVRIDTGIDSRSNTSPCH